MAHPTSALHQGPCDGAKIGTLDRGEAAAGKADADKTGNGAGTRWTLAATVMGSSLSFLDGSVVNVALPSIAHDLQAGSAGVQWVVNAYLLPLGALVLIGGSLADRIGRRQIFLAGIALFALASLITLAAPTIAVLIAGRLGQGIGAAMFVPASLAILGADFQGEARARAIGTWAASGAIAGAVGPVLGGWLVDGFGWRAIFALILPWAIVTLAVGWRAIPSHARGDGRIDWGGAAIGAAALALIAYGLTLVSDVGILGLATALIAGGAALFALFLWIEYRQGAAAMMPLALFRTPTFVGVTMLTFLLYAALGGVLLLLPYLLIVRGWSATSAGAALLPLPVLIGLGSRQAGALAERIGARPMLVAGPIVVAAGFSWLARMPGGGIDFAVDLLPAMLAIGGGMTIAVAPLTALVMSAVDLEHAGAASGVNNATARVGGLIATALAGLALTTDGVSMPAFHLAAGIASVAALLSAAAAGILVSRR